MSVLVSIVVPCYNHGKFLDELIESIRQSEISCSYELLIVNDGSTDQFTIDKLAELESKGYQVVHQTNSGLGKTRNNAIKLAEGKYIFPLDSDNKLCKGFLEKAIEVLENSNKFDIVYSDANYFGEQTGRWVVGEFNLQRMMIKSYIDACALYRRALWEDLGGYDEHMPAMGLEDWDYWLRAAFNGFKFYYLPVVGFEYRVLSNSMIRSYSSSDLATLKNYIAKKHHLMLGAPFISDFVMQKFKRNKRLSLKLLISLYAPRLFHFLVKKGVFNTAAIV